MRLYIVGNGFDLQHCLRTSPKDYCDFLNEEYPDFLDEIKSSEYFVGDGSELTEREDRFWTNVEGNLVFCYQQMLDDTAEEYYPDLLEDSDARWHHAEFDAEEKVKAFDEIKKFNTTYLVEWIQSIDINDAKRLRQMRFKPSDLFVNFNYTKTLEVVYGIEPKAVLHIHGCISNPQSIQFGNPEYTAKEVRSDAEDSYGSDEFYGASIEPAVNHYVDLADSFSKDIKLNIPKLKRFIARRDVDEVVVMGHSYQGVDKYYYEKVLIPKFNLVKWKIYCRNFKGIDEAYDFFRFHNINGSVAIWKEKGKRWLRFKLLLYALWKRMSL